MRIIDLHSHFSTEKGFRFRTEEEREKAEEAFNREFELRTREGMVQDFAEADVEAMLDFGFTLDLSAEEIREYHNYAADIISSSDRFIGFWVDIDPTLGIDAHEEIRRCFEDLDLGVTGLTINAIGNHMSPTDDRYDPFYELCIEYEAPAHINVGYTNRGAGFPGGKGHELERCHPRHVDEVAARYPELKIIAGRPGWPWQSEIIATAMHKENVVGYELHGWRPKYYPDELVYEINHRLEDKIMFGGDYPFYQYDQIVQDWKDHGFEEQVLEKVFYRNAERILDTFR